MQNENTEIKSGRVAAAMMLIALLLLLVIASMNTGCQRAQGRKLVAFQASVDKPEKVVHYCAGMTKKGERCRKHVKAEGQFCWMHQGQKKN